MRGGKKMAIADKVVKNGDIFEPSNTTEFLTLNISSGNSSPECNETSYSISPSFVIPTITSDSTFFSFSPTFGSTFSPGSRTFSYQTPSYQDF